MTNTPLRRIPRNELPEAMQAGWDRSMMLCGEATIIEVMANSPTASKLFFEEFYAKTFFGGEVDRRYKELLRLKLSTIHGCRFCNRNNIAGSKEVGYSDAQIEAIDDAQSTLFTPAERSVLKLAEEMALTNMGGQLTPALYRELKQHFTDSQIVEMGVVMALLGGLNKLAFVFDLVTKEEYCPFVPAQAAE